MNNENDLFLKQMKGVVQIKKNNRIPNTKITKKNKLEKNKTKPRTSPGLEKNITSNIKTPHFSLEKIRIKRNIKKNTIQIDKKIDFHGKSLLRAEEVFSSTVVDCFGQHKRCLLFITGKGVFKPKNHDEFIKPKLYHGVIRESFIEWVKSKKFSKYILSYEQASKEHGGDGAFYVYLRKNKN